MVTDMKGSGRMTKRTVEAFSRSLTGTDTRGNG